MGAKLDDAPGVEYRDPVGRADRGKSMGDDKGGAALHEALERDLHQALALAVEGAGGFIENKDRGVFENRPGDGDALALAA